jgi:hypothetical protein
MEITVYVEPVGSGYRASTGSPVPLSAEGPSEDAAVAAIRDQLAARRRAGGRFRTLTVDDIEPLVAAARAVGANPLFEDWAKSVDDYRKANNAVPDAD